MISFYLLSLIATSQVLVEYSPLEYPDLTLPATLLVNIRGCGYPPQVSQLFRNTFWQINSSDSNSGLSFHVYKLRFAL